MTINFDATSEAKRVPANSSKTYVLKAATAVDTASVTDTINLALLADQAYPALPGTVLMGPVATTTLTQDGGTIYPIDTGINAQGASTTNRTIWTPFSTTSPAITAASEWNIDWTNSYGMPGFPSAGQDFPIQTWSRPD